MDIAERLLQLREAKKLSQGDIQERTGLIRSYVSRVEHGHTIPTIETLEKFCQALQVPLYQIFYDGQELPEAPIFSDNGKSDWTSHGNGQRLLSKLRHALSHTTEADRRLLLNLAGHMASAKRRASPSERDSRGRYG
jgi:transcriptional regulator with XRE-family HTH domain